MGNFFNIKMAHLRGFWVLNLVFFMTQNGLLSTQNPLKCAILISKYFPYPDFLSAGSFLLGLLWPERVTCQPFRKSFYAYAPALNQLCLAVPPGENYIFHNISLNDKTPSPSHNKGSCRSLIYRVSAPTGCWRWAPPISQLVVRK